METGIGTSVLRSLGRRAPLRDVAALLEAAAETGVRYLDTADTYGAGSAERALGAAVLRARLDPRAFRVITKGGFVFPDLPGAARALNQPAKRLAGLRGPRQRFDTPYLRRAADASRRRLGPLRLHAYCLHNPTEQVLRDGGALGALRALKEAGAFAKAGVSIDDHALAPVVAALPGGVDLLELPARALLDMDADTRALLEHRGTEIVVNRVGDLGGVADGLTRLRDLAAPPAVAVVGTRNPAHLRSNAAAERTP